jgi:hypothetical protein
MLDSTCRARAHFLLPRCSVFHGRIIPWNVNVKSKSRQATVTTGVIRISGTWKSMKVNAVSEEDFTSAEIHGSFTTRARTETLNLYWAMSYVD